MTRDRAPVTEAAPGAQAMDAVVLAGGRGRRFGGDKVQVRVDGIRLVDRVVTALAPLGGRVVVAVGSRPLAVAGTIEVGDRPADAGPLGGLAAALDVVTSDWAAIVAGDLLAPAPALLVSLRAHASVMGTAGAMPVVDGLPQPLHAVVHTQQMRQAVADALRKDERRVVELFIAVGVATVDEAIWRRWAPSARPAADVDRIGDVPRNPSRARPTNRAD